VKGSNTQTFSILAILFFFILTAAGCAPPKYVSASGKELILRPDVKNQYGSIDSSAAERCMEGDTKVFKKLFGERYNPCAELGIFLINNHLPEEGIPLFEKAISEAASFNADYSRFTSESIGIMQSTRLANFLFDVCLNRKISNLSDNRDITAEMCGKAGELFEKVKYLENAAIMYKKKCELTGNCAEKKRLEELDKNMP